MELLRFARGRRSERNYLVNVLTEPDPLAIGEWFLLQRAVCCSNFSESCFQIDTGCSATARHLLQAPQVENEAGLCLDVVNNTVHRIRSAAAR